MTPEQFCYWLQGLMECRNEGDFLTARETAAIKDHLALVFTKVTPDRSEDVELTPEQIEEGLRAKRKAAFREKNLSNAISQTKRIC
jgi:D-aminopeptidase